MRELDRMIALSIKKDQTAISELLMFQIEKINRLAGFSIIKEEISNGIKAKMLEVCLKMDFEEKSLIPFCIVPSIKGSVSNFFSCIAESFLSEEVFVEDHKLDKFVPVSNKNFIIKDVFAPKFANTNLRSMKKDLSYYKNFPITFEEFVALQYIFEDFIKVGAGLVPFFESWRPNSFSETQIIFEYLVYNKNEREISLFWRDSYIQNESLQVFFRNRINL